MAQENGIIIEVSDNGTDWSELVYLSADVKTYTHEGLASGVTKHYRIKAVGDGVNTLDSPYSSAVSATTGVVDSEAPTAPALLTSSGATDSSVTLNWQPATDNTGVTAYEIYQAGVYIDETTGTSYQATGLTPDSDYAFTVKARDAAGNLSAASNTENVRTLAAASGYHTESVAVFSRFTGANELTTAEKDATDRFIRGQISAGNWAKIHAFIPLSGYSSAAKALIEFKSGVAGVNVNSAAYSPATGFTTNGTSQYINSNITPSVFGAALNDITYAAHCIENLGLFHVGVIGTDINAQAILNVTSAGVIGHKHHQSNSIGGTYTSINVADTLHSVGRETSSLVRVNQDAQQIKLQDSYLASAIPDKPIYLGARNYNGPNTYGAARYGSLIVHQHSGFNYQAFYFYWEQFLMELGVKVKHELYSADLPAKSYATTDALLLNSEGQSNSLFAGAATGLQTGLGLASEMLGVKVFWRPDFTQPLTLQNLHYLNTHTLDSSAGAGKFAAGMRVAKELQDTQNLKPYLWFYGKSGTKLAQTTGADWNVASTSELLYDTHTRIGQPGLALVTEPIKKIVWHWGQGEADAADQTTEQYTANFYALLKAKIDFYEARGLNLSIAKLHVIAPKIGAALPIASYPNRDQILAAQNAFSIANFDAAYPGYGAKVTTLKVYNNDRLLRTDGTHLNPEGYHIEGYRLAAYIQKL